MGLEGLPLPSTPIELIAVVTFILVNGWVLYSQNRKARSERSELADSVAVVRDQVENTHTTNLRHDIDGITEGLKLLQAMVSVNHAQQVKFQADVYENLQQLNLVAVKNHPKDMK